MSNKNPAYFAFWADRWLGGTSGWSAEEKGCYISLLVHQFVHGVIPSDMRRLARIAGCPTEQAFGMAWESVLRDKFEPVDGGYANPRMAEERERSVKHNRQRREAGRKSAAARTAVAAVVPTAVQTTDGAGAATTQTQTHTHNHTPEPKKRARAREVCVEDLTSDPLVISAASEWMRYRREAKLRPWTLTTWRQKLAKAEQDPQAFRDSVRYSIEQGYQGLYAERKDRGRPGSGLTKGQEALKEFFDDATS